MNCKCNSLKDLIGQLRITRKFQKRLADIKVRNAEDLRHYRNLQKATNLEECKLDALLRLHLSEDQMPMF